MLELNTFAGEYAAVRIGLWCQSASSGDDFRQAFATANFVQARPVKLANQQDWTGVAVCCNRIEPDDIARTDHNFIGAKFYKIDKTARRIRRAFDCIWRIPGNFHSGQIDFSTKPASDSDQIRQADVANDRIGPREAHFAIYGNDMLKSEW